jgi:hypothetical protein
MPDISLKRESLSLASGKDLPEPTSVSFNGVPASLCGRACGNRGCDVRVGNHRGLRHRDNSQRHAQQQRAVPCDSVAT